MRIRRTTQVEHFSVHARGMAAKLVCQPRLADARLAAQRDAAAVAGQHRGPVRVERRALARPPDVGAERADTFQPRLGAARRRHAPQPHRLRHTPQFALAVRLTAEIALHDPPGGVAHHQRVGVSRRLHPRGDVGCVTLREVLLARAAADRADDNAAGVCAGAHMQVHAVHARRALAQRQHAAQDVEPATHRAPRVVFMRSRESEVDQHAVAEVLRDVPVVARHRFGAHPLVVGEQVAQVFGVERLRQRGRADDVAHQDRDLAALAGAGGAGRGVERLAASAAKARRVSVREPAIRTVHLARPAGRFVAQRACQAAFSSARIFSARATRSAGSTPGCCAMTAVACGPACSVGRAAARLG